MSWIDVIRLIVLKFRKFIWKAVFILLSWLVGFSLVLVFFKDVDEKSLSVSDICFTSSCLNDFSEEFSGFLALASFWSEIITLVVVVWGASVALRNYNVAARSSVLIGYVEHIRLFRDYVSDEMNRFDSINSSRINSQYWYHVAFPKSKLGDIDVSDEYIALVKNISKAIEITNEAIGKPKGEYGYAKHQDRMIAAFEGVGISMERLPKNDFLKVEEELLMLIDSINYAFNPGHRREDDLSRVPRDYV